METTPELSNDSVAQLNNGVFDRDILPNVLCKLTMRDLQNARLVCKAWNSCFVSASFRNLYDDSSRGLLLAALVRPTGMCRIQGLILYDIENGTRYCNKGLEAPAYPYGTVVAGGAGGLVIFATTYFTDSVPGILSADGHLIKSIKINSIYMQNPMHPNAPQRIQRLPTLVPDVTFLVMPKLLLVDSPNCRQRIVLAGYVMTQETGGSEIVLSVYDFVCGRWSEVDLTPTGIEEASNDEMINRVDSREEIRMTDPSLFGVVVSGVTLYIFSSVLYPECLFAVNLESKFWNHWKVPHSGHLDPDMDVKTTLLSYGDRLFLAAMIANPMDILPLHEDASIEGSIYILEAELNNAVCIWNEISRIPKELLDDLYSGPDSALEVHCIDLGTLACFMVGRYSSANPHITFRTISYEMPDGPWRKMPSLVLPTIAEALDFFNGIVFKPKFTAVHVI